MDKREDSRMINGAGLISVIISAYNAEKYIQPCIKSILNQSYQNIEMIICDDCSTDGTRDVLKQYSLNKKIKILYNAKNMRQAASRNRCLSKCSGKYIMIQDADDLSDAFRAEKLLGALEEDISFVGSSCYYFDENGPYYRKENKKKYPERKDLLAGMPFVHASILFRKECLDAVGGYRVSRFTKRAEDYDLILRLYGAGHKGKNIREPLYWYRVDQDTLSRRDLKSRLEECLIRFQGYRQNRILFPMGIFYAMKPIPAYLYHIIKDRNYKKWAGR